MTIEYDEKGKYYTNVIQKVHVPAIIQTTKHLIRGMIHVRHDQRLKDELESTEQFLAVTEASVCGEDGKVVFSGSFLAVLKEEIVWVMPVHEEQKKDDDQ